MRGIRSAAALAVGVALVSAALAGCTSSGTAPETPSPTTFTRTVVETPSSSHVPTKPVSTGPTTAATAQHCPFLDRQVAIKKSGMRLDRITVLHSGGKVVGCRIYGLQHPNAECNATCLANERLPGPKQPAIEISILQYPSSLAAHNALVIAARKGTNALQAAIVGQAPGVCFQNDFYPKDNGADWGCAFSKGDKMVLVRTVVTTGELSAVYVTRAVAATMT